MLDSIDTILYSEFEQCADAIINGDLATLKHLVDQYPELVHARSTLEHHSTLLFYVTANSVEDERQKTPDNVLEIAQFLLAKEADPNAVSDAYGGGATILGSVVSSAHPAHADKQADLVKLLCQYGADPDANDSAPLKTAIAFRYPKAISALVECGTSLNHAVFAATMGDLQQVKGFIQEGVKPFTTAFGVEFKDEKSVLEFALTTASMMGHREVVEYLLEQEIDVNAPCSAEEGTALHEASITGQVEIATLLLQAGADVTVQDHQGFTPLHWASWHQRHDVMDILLQHHAPLEILNGYGGTVLDSTVHGFIHTHYPPPDPLPTLQKLIDAGADVHQVNPFPTGHSEIDTLLRAYRNPKT